MAEPASDAETPSETATAPTPPPGMLHVPGGAFLFAKRKHEVELGEFWIDEYPVTNGDYEAYVAEHRQRPPRHWPASGLTDELRDQPVVRLTYAEVETYARLMGRQLPTPAQFEKAARGTDGRKYPWGNEIRGRVTNTKESGIGKLTSVDTFPAGCSPCGAYDMAGNVLHWTRGVADEAKQLMTVMGGSFMHYLGATYWTYEEAATARRDYLGFRCVWTPDTPPPSDG
jgi:formylglycine-generating enzyme required for sulfatase activity